MNAPQQFFEAIAAAMPDTKLGKMFGAQCIKTPNGKAAVMFKDEHIVFKLQGIAYAEALGLDGATLFDPMGGRPMKEWVQLPYRYKDQWEKFAKSAVEYVKELK